MPPRPRLRRRRPQHPQRQHLRLLRQRRQFPRKLPGPRSVLTIRLDGGPQKDGFYWEYYTGDKGDATFVELITQANDDGCAYAGSFKAIEDAGDAEDYIRLVYTNGT